VISTIIVLKFLKVLTECGEPLKTTNFMQSSGK